MSTAEAPERQPVIRFESFELDPSRQTLTRDGIRLKLQKQPLQVLELLISRAPEIVSSDQIRRHVWGGDVYIDAAQSIRFCIRQIRSVLNDTSAAPRFVETLPKQGYRFIAALEGVPAKSEVPAAASQVVLLKPAWERFLVQGLIAVSAVALLAVWWAWYVKKDKDLRVAAVIPLTTYPGEELQPSLSPDGRQVAFSWNGENQDVFHVYVKLLGEQHPIRLTQSPEQESYAAWSPDGKRIAFIRWHTDLQADIVMIPSDGGGPEQIVHSVQLGRVTDDSSRVLAWSPDGKWLCFVSETEPSGHHSLFFASLESGALRRLSGGNDKNLGDSAPAFSPDGRWLAFARLSGPQVSRLMLQRLSESLEPKGDPLEVKDAGTNPRTPVWTPDGKSLLFLEHGDIMQAGIGAPARRINVASNLEGLNMAAHKQRLAAARGSVDVDIWTVPLRSGGLVAGGRPTLIVRSMAGEAMPSYSPDGRWLAFTSERTGASEIWLADANGKNPRQLTHLGAYISAFAHWSPDSRFVTFHARVPKLAQVYVTRIDDGMTRQLTDSQTNFVVPSWSEDGKNIYMSDGVSSDPYKVPTAGGTARRLWDGIGALQVEVPSRKLLLYAKTDMPGVYARSLDGDPSKNPEIKLVADYIPHNGGICPFNDGFYYSAFTASGVSRAVCFYSFASHKAVDVFPLAPDIGLGLSVSPDRTRLAYTARTNGNIGLVEIELK